MIITKLSQKWQLFDREAKIYREKIKKYCKKNTDLLKYIIA